MMLASSNLAAALSDLSEPPLATWDAGPGRPALGSGEVHLWLADLTRPAWDGQQLEAVLSEDERRHAVRFRQPQDRIRYGRAHALLRWLLSRYVDQPPGQLELNRGPQGKPFLGKTAEASPIRFNMAHSADLCLYAVAQGQEVGVDLEQARGDLDLDYIAQRFFLPAEASLIRTAPAERKSSIFLGLWTAKEACVKAMGRGLSVPVDQIKLVRDAVGQERVVFEGAEWSLVRFTVVPGCPGAAVCQHPRPRVRFGSLVL